MTMADGRRVAIVTGATRGIGKGIALELGRAGYAVHAVGRSSRSDPDRDVSAEMGEYRRLPADEELTVERTAEQVDALGGRGAASATAAAYAVPSQKLRDDFWKQGMAMWDAVNGVGLRAVYASCLAAAPPMIETAQKHADATPLIALVDRLAGDMALQLKKHGVATTALYPGLVRTEANLEMVDMGTWDEASGGLDLAVGETPAFSGRGLVALLGLPQADLLARSGNVEVIAELADEFGFDDVDGARPCSIRSLRYLLPNFVFPQVEKEAGKPVPAWIRDNVPDVLLPWSVFSAGPPPEPAD
ncbi:hypothetical protein JL721_9208 [Aureococcus anophagefferens]|nr:hypothetical protein JL721_9208 [Aureococcus anophagefferens]